MIIIFVLSISILFILGARYRNSDLNIISENDFGDYKHIYARINFKNQLFRANDLYRIKDIKVNYDNILDYTFHSLGYINLKVKNHVPNNFSVSYNLKFNDKIYEIPIVLFTVIFLILFYKIGSNNLEIKNYKIILYYARTGKSSTVKAVANFFKDEGLRLIEIKKNQLHFITDIIEKLSCSPLKFIIFIDDLTFSSNDDTFSYLKAILEGGVNSFPNNIAVYVTSNYRHLIKENFTDRTGDDIHIEDTIQQIMSLTNRFGMIITFQRPGRDLFKEIVLSYAKENNIKTDKEELINQAEAYAIRSAGRSPRVAKQFIELLKQ